MPFFVRSCNNGKTFELRIKHGRLPKPAAPSAHCGVASPTRGTTLRQRLGPRGCATLVGLATDVPLWGVCIRQLAGCLLQFRLLPKPHKATRRACVLARWFARDQPCPALCIAHAPAKTRSIILLLTASREVT
jgi:hypothetical protein